MTETGPLLVTAPVAAEILGVSRAFIYKLADAGELELVHLGRASRVRVSDLERLAREGATIEAA